MYRTGAQTLGLALLAILLLCTSLTACKDKPEDSAAGGGNGTADSGEKPSVSSDARARSIFEGTSLAEETPGSLDLSRDGKRLFVRTQLKGEHEYSIISFPLEGGKLGHVMEHARSPFLNRDFLRAHPSQPRCLVIAAEKQDDGLIRDNVWEFRDKRVLADYTKAEGYPGDIPATALVGLEPFYSWTGDDVIVPLKERGLCVVGMNGAASSFVPYPPLAFKPTGMELGALPSASGRGQIFASFWSITGQRDMELCSIYLLDLNTMQWGSPVSAPWVVYRIGSLDPAIEPWLATGSRLPEVNTEKHRVPRLGRIDPGSGMSDLLEYGGEPVWDVLMDPMGRYIVYMDSVRSALVRFNPASGLLEFDKGAFDPQARMFFSAISGDVYVWNKTRLIRGDFKDSEQLEGFDG